MVITMIFSAQHPNEEPEWLIVLEEEQKGKYSIIGYRKGEIPSKCNYSISKLEKDYNKMSEDLKELRKRLNGRDGWNNRLVKGIIEIEKQLDQYGKYESEW